MKFLVKTVYTLVPKTLSNEFEKFMNENNIIEYSVLSIKGRNSVSLQFYNHIDYSLFNLGNIELKFLNFISR